MLLTQKKKLKRLIKIQIEAANKNSKKNTKKMICLITMVFIALAAITLILISLLT